MITINKNLDGSYSKTEIWANGITTTTSSFSVSDLIKILIAKGLIKEEDLK